MNERITIDQLPNGLYAARRKNSDVKGRGPSSIEAHGDLLEKEEAAGLLAASIKEDREV